MILSENQSDLFSAYEEAMKSGHQLLGSYPWNERVFYAMWMSQIYYFVCKATRLIPYAAALFDEQDENFHVRCIEHGMEEKGHQLIALADLHILGYEIGQFAELLETKQFYRNQFWMIQNKDPISLFGINLYMEGMSLHVGKVICNQLIKHYGPQASQFMIEHCQADEHHIEEAFKVVKSLPAQRQEVVKESLLLARMNFEQINKKVFETWQVLPLQQESSPQEALQL